MSPLYLHHVSISTTDLARSVEFYNGLLGLTLLQRPAFKSQGAWLLCGDQQIHLNLKPNAPCAPDKQINPTEPHFALRVETVDPWIAAFKSNGYREGAGADEPKQMMVDRNGLAGFPQVFVLDPDRNTIEINAAA